jgi:penicillin V acylase-like amidase (Ntn superfamily)
VLNQFDIPLGSVVEEEPNGTKNYEETQWTSAADLSGSKYYFHTFQNRTIHMADLHKLDLDAKETKSIPINAPEQIVDISDKFK